MMKLREEKGNEFETKMTVKKLYLDYGKDCEKMK